MPMRVDEPRHADHAAAVDDLDIGQIDAWSHRDDRAIAHVHVARPKISDIGVHGQHGGTTDDEFAAVRELFEQWDATFSRFRPDSELNRINADPSPVALLSRTFAYALREALAAAVTTNGLVDPTLGAALEAAGYDRDFDLLHDDDDCPPGPPSPGRWRSLRLGGRLLSRPPSLVLDLNGVVKSLAVDDALRLLSGGGFVSAGGDIAVSKETTTSVTSMRTPVRESVASVPTASRLATSAQRRWPVSRAR